MLPPRRGGSTGGSFFGIGWERVGAFQNLKIRMLPPRRGGSTGGSIFQFGWEQGGAYDPFENGRCKSLV